MTESNIFIKQDSEQEYNIDTEQILSIIPRKCYKTKQTSLAHLIEWIWKVYSIDDVQYMTISYKKPNGKQMFLNKYGKWYEGSDHIKYDKNLIKQKYFYTNN